MIKTAPDNQRQLFRLKKSSLFQIIVFIFALAVLIPQIRQFSGSGGYLQDASPGWVLLAFCGMFMTIVFASLVYIVLVPKKLYFKRTLLIQLATYFTNRLLPSGLGGIGFNALYLVKQAKLSRTDSAVYATANNLIGFVAFSISVGIVSLIGDSNIDIGTPRPLYILITVGLLLLLATLALTVRRLQKAIFEFLGHLFGVILAIIKHPKRLIGSIILSIGITASYVLMLWASTKSVGINISVVDLFIAFVAGNAALTISPTPGGIGAVEAAITAVLVSAGVTPSLALASVVVYRIVSYWVPIIPGYLAFHRATKRQYV